MNRGGVCEDRDDSVKAQRNPAGWGETFFECVNEGFVEWEGGFPEFSAKREIFLTSFALLDWVNEFGKTVAQFVSCPKKLEALGESGVGGLFLGEGCLGNGIVIQKCWGALSKMRFNLIEQNLIIDFFPCCLVGHGVAFLFRFR